MSNINSSHVQMEYLTRPRLRLLSNMTFSFHFQTLHPNWSFMFLRIIKIYISDGERRTSGHESRQDPKRGGRPPEGGVHITRLYLSGVYKLGQVNF